MENKKKYKCSIASIYFINNVWCNGPKDQIPAHIVELIKVQETGNSVYFFMELCDGGDFGSYLEKHKPFLSEE